MSPDDSSSTTSDSQVSGVRKVFNKLFKGKSNRQHDSDSYSEILSTSRESFARVLTDGGLFTEFKAFCESDNGGNYLLFCENFTRLEQLVAEAARYGKGGRSDGKTTYPSMVRFLSADSKATTSPENSASTAMEVPVWLVSHFLVFHASFIAPGAPHSVVISDNARKRISDQLAAGGLHKVRASIFDQSADEVLDALYRSWFPRFLAHRTGHPLPPLPERLIPEIPPSESPQNVSAERLPGIDQRSNKSDKSEKKKKDGVGVPMNGFEALSALAAGNDSGGRKLSLGRNNSASELSSDSPRKSEVNVGELQYTRESFAKVLYDPVLYSDFQELAEADHCKENLMFFENYTKLEQLLADYVPKYGGGSRGRTGLSVPKDMSYTRSVARFLHHGTEEAANQQTVDIPVPVRLVSHFLLFHASFIAPGAPHEVNITDKLRRRIAEQLAAGGGHRVPATVFDGAADEVLGLLYQNTFRKFVKQKTASVTADKNALNTLDALFDDADGKQKNASGNRPSKNANKGYDALFADEGEVNGKSKPKSSAPPSPVPPRASEVKAMNPLDALIMDDGSNAKQRTPAIPNSAATLADVKAMNTMDALFSEDDAAAKQKIAANTSAAMPNKAFDALFAEDDPSQKPVNTAEKKFDALFTDDHGSSRQKATSGAAASSEKSKYDALFADEAAGAQQRASTTSASAAAPAAPRTSNVKPMNPLDALIMEDGPSGKRKVPAVTANSGTVADVKAMNKMDALFSDDNPGGNRKSTADKKPANKLDALLSE
ncbi:hypothetical protein HK102_004229 [Quaeritorhiza haematococci]|nr:hypothetical protein HK102_004229 [Quaeritorhiza haematococci]